MPVEIVSPVARIVWGHPSKPRDVIDQQTKKPRTNEDGTKRRSITFGLAVPKADWQAISDAMVQAAQQEFPGGFPGNFAWKFKDGDTGVDNDGKALRERDGYAGCYVLACSTELIGSVGNFTYDHGSQKWVDGASVIKCGDFVKVTLSLNAHKARNNTEKPGLYVNPTCVMLWQSGPEIKGGDVDPNARGFAPPPPQTPPAGAMPSAPNPAPGPGPQPTPQPTGATPQAGAGPQANPHTQFLNGPRPE